MYNFKDSGNRNRDLCFFDLEATGLSAYSEILEIGAIRIETDSLNIMEEFSTKTLPERIETADPEALEVVGYDEKVWKKEAIPIKEALEKFLVFAEDCVLVAHNLPFDWMWLQRSLEDNGLNPTFFYHGLDTISLAWLKTQQDKIKTGLSLKNLSRQFDIDMGTHHNALEDAKTAYNIFVKLIETDEEADN
ncbi:MAG: hypothetical protein COT88_01490 [Candidatus Colwellbacteria bacterium CG10_big_fil_rev_8_21_14_0_10_41_28]|uniref:Exonuclease domain-containing protein n=1 Tax=Candidatus Colwellbacteria bacterium CG10_big_fil_rev_8_21_14_0_10_41_28 TaxID=1974539 RepID=A0A2H0VHC1_9BACT|nr:MAG: hypothetical protein COT88_01490 [Candidatus Colwellbacteria bacterium CG10_big_fil_rev_8_21_14_0_10_41_28]